MAKKNKKEKIEKEIITCMDSIAKQNPYHQVDMFKGDRGKYQGEIGLLGSGEKSGKPIHY